MFGHGVRQGPRSNSRLRGGGGGGAPLVTRYWGGHKTPFLTLYNSKNIGGGGHVPPPPPSLVPYAPRSLLGLKRNWSGSKDFRPFYTCVGFLTVVYIEKSLKTGWVKEF